MCAISNSDAGRDCWVLICYLTVGEIHDYLLLCLHSASLLLPFLSWRNTLLFLCDLCRTVFLLACSFAGLHTLFCISAGNSLQNDGVSFPGRIVETAAAA